MKQNLVRADNYPPQPNPPQTDNPRTVRADNHPPQPPRRKFIRKRGYDYSKSGFYFITINTQNRAHHFGYILPERDTKANLSLPIRGVMFHTEVGLLANQCWEDIPKHFPNVVVHAYVVMPDHMHGLIEITKWFRMYSDIEKVWQRDYYERIIKDQNQYDVTKNYIEQNITKWAIKELNNTKGRN